MDQRTRGSVIGALLALSLAGAGARAQTIAVGRPTSITILESDPRRGTGRYQDFRIVFAQGDRLSVNIQGADGVAIPSAVHILPGHGRSGQAIDYTRNAEANLSWTSTPLPEGEQIVRIVAYKPFGQLSVLLKRVGPDEEPGEDPAPTPSPTPPASPADDPSTLSDADLFARRAELARQIELLDREIERRRAQRPRPAPR